MSSLDCKTGLIGRWNWEILTDAKGRQFVAEKEGWNGDG